MKNCFTFAIAMLALTFISSVSLASDEDDVPGQWVCFAHDYVSGHSKNDPETDDCIQSYHRGEGICLSHAKSAAFERCLSYSKNKSTCKMDVYKNCFRANARPSK